MRCKTGLTKERTYAYVQGVRTGRTYRALGPLRHNIPFSHNQNTHFCPTDSSYILAYIRTLFAQARACARAPRASRATSPSRGSTRTHRYRWCGGSCGGNGAKAPRGSGNGVPHTHATGGPRTLMRSSGGTGKEEARMRRTGWDPPAGLTSGPSAFRGSQHRPARGAPAEGPELGGQSSKGSGHVLLFDPSVIIDPPSRPRGWQERDPGKGTRVHRDSTLRTSSHPRRPSPSRVTADTYGGLRPRACASRATAPATTRTESQG